MIIDVGVLLCENDGWVYIYIYICYVIVSVSCGCCVSECEKVEL
jgi:hypothetical protein